VFLERGGGNGWFRNGMSSHSINHCTPITALIRLTPAEDACSFMILKETSSPVFFACGPPQISFEYPEIVYTLTI